jgi:hypothetical protein
VSVSTTIHPPPVASEQRLGAFKSAADLGIRVAWSFAFVGPGTRLIGSPGTLAIDVGGSMGAGVIDHHAGDSGARSSAGLAITRPELSIGHLLAPLWELAAAGVDVAGRVLSIRLVTHVSPDFDAIVAFVAAKHWVEFGRVPEWLVRLGEFVDLTDQGEFHGDAGGLNEDGSRRLPLHETYLIAQSQQRTRAMSDWALLQCGVELMERFGRQASDESWFEVTDAGRKVTVPVLQAGSDDRTLAEYVDTMDAAQAAYRLDLAGAAVEQVRVPVLLAGEEPGTARVRAIALADEPRSVLFKYLARRAGFVLIVWPYRKPVGSWRADTVHPQAKPRSTQQFPRVVISTNAALRIAVDPAGPTPSLDAGVASPMPKGKPCIIGLGRQLETLERQADATSARPRGGPPRFEPDYCDNADPWYDGRGQDYTIVDGPRAGTLLDYATILWMVGFSGLPVGVSPRPPTTTGVQAPLQYWEPVVHWGVCLRVDAVGCNFTPDELTEDSSPTALTAALGQWWEGLVRRATAVTVGEAEFTQVLRVGDSGRYTFRVRGALARNGLTLAEWGSVASETAAADGNPALTTVHEVSTGAEVRGDRLVRALIGADHTVPATDGDRLFHADQRFCLHAETPPNPSAPPGWLVPAVHSTIAVAGLREWRRWFESALADTASRNRAGLVSALARFWVWESRWTETSARNDESAKRIETIVRDLGPLEELLETTRRLATRLDAVVQRLEAADDARASRILNNTLFLVACVGVLQFFQAAQSSPIVWARDWWWLVGVPLGFFLALEWATGVGRRTWKRVAGRGKSTS